MMRRRNDGETDWNWKLMVMCLSLCFVPFLSACGNRTITGQLWPDSRDAGLVTGKGGGAIARTAVSQLGKPYRYGGSTPRGFDCSGLIWWAYKQHGVTIPRVTTGQARAGKAVKSNAMQAGDILVFSTRSGGTGLHTALYMGNGAFVHSPSSGNRVRTDKITDAYWNKRLVQIRRILR